MNIDIDHLLEQNSGCLKMAQTSTTCMTQGIVWNAMTFLCQFALLHAVQLSLYAVLFLFGCGTPLITCAIYDVISCAFFVICCGFATIYGAYVIICSDFSIIPTFFHSISTILSLYRVVYALYGVQTILPRVHFVLFAVLSSFRKDSATRKWIHMSYWPCRKVL